MALILESPTRLRIDADVPLELLQDTLGYVDLRVGHELRRWKEYQRIDDRAIEILEAGGEVPRHWYVEKYGRDALDWKIEQLDAEQYKSLLFEDEKGYWTYSGLGDRLEKVLGDEVVESPEMAARPAPRPIQWSPPPYEPRWYQHKAVKKLTEYGHGAVELATGMGKSLIIALLLRHYGLPGIVLAPSLSIARQLHADLVERFGKKHVGQFYGGKKDSKKMFTVAVSNSVLRCQPDDPHWENLTKKSVVIGDESHLLPADTLSKVVLGMFSEVPYRFFLSGTQMRGDGLGLLLEAITGRIFMRMGVTDGYREGVLTPQRFFRFQVTSDSKYNNTDSIKMTRVHLQRNSKIYAHAGRLINEGVRRGRRVLVFVQEMDQFAALLPHLNYDVRFAHGGLTKKQKDKNIFPEAYHKSNPMELVKQFDAGEFSILVGTSCIGTGTDIKSVTLAVDLVGGKAETRIRQNVGRCTRKFPGKKECVYVVYHVTNIPVLNKHALAVHKILSTIGPVEAKRV